MTIVYNGDMWHKCLILVLLGCFFSPSYSNVKARECLIKVSMHFKNVDIMLCHQLEGPL